jgi:hypothetical protein
MVAHFQMNRATPQMRHFAKRLIVFETRQNLSVATKPRPAFPVPEKLRPHLVALMGNGGFEALLARALALAKTEVPWLRPVHVNAGGVMEGLEEIPAQVGADEFLEGRIVLLAQLLGLLVAFIGENLTLRLVHEVWPKVPLDDLNLESRGKK